MKPKDLLKEEALRIYRWLLQVDYRGIALRIITFIGKVMHKLLFGFLLPKRYRTLTKRQIFEVVFRSDNPMGKKFDIWLLCLILANIFLLVLDTTVGSTDTITSGAHMSASFFVFKLLEWLFTILFTFEYYLRVYCLKHPQKYVLSFWGIIDFLSIFPSYLSLLFPATQALTVLRLLRVMRIFRIFKLERFQKESLLLLNALRTSAIKILIFMLFVLVAAVILGTVVYSLEGESNPDFKSIPSGIYWAVVTITTVGYGDVAPQTTTGRFLSVIVMLLGYSIIAVSTGIVAGETINEHRHPHRHRFKNPLENEYKDDEASND